MRIQLGVAVIVTAACAVVSLAGPPTLAANASQPVENVSPAPDPYVLFAASVRAMRAAHRLGKPAYMAYKLSCDLHNLAMQKAKGPGDPMDFALVHANHHYDFQAWYRSKDGSALSQDLATHQEYEDALFDPEAASMDEEGTGASPSPSPSPSAAATPEIGGPPSLGKFSVNGNRYYRITLVGLESLDGNQAYHLHLTALRDDKEHPLTDLWIDSSTMLMRKARASFSFRAVAFGGGGDGDVTFGQVGKYWMATGFDFNATGYAFVWHANVGMNVRAYDIMPLDSLPDAYFAKRR